MGGLTGSGPIISALPETDDQKLTYEAYELGGLRPKVHKYGDEVRVLEAARRFPAPAEASPSAPEVVSFMFEIPGVVPEISWEDFVKGAACASAIVRPEFYPGIKEALGKVAERVIAGGQLPAIDVSFAPEMIECQTKIFQNGEASSWRPLLSFMQGAFWLLTFVKDPKRKKSAGISPLAWTEEMVGTFSQLAYVPR